MPVDLSIGTGSNQLKCDKIILWYKWFWTEPLTAFTWFYEKNYNFCCRRCWHCPTHMPLKHLRGHWWQPWTILWPCASSACLLWPWEWSSYMQSRWSCRDVGASRSTPQPRTKGSLWVDTAPSLPTGVTVLRRILHGHAEGRQQVWATTAHSGPGFINGLFIGLNPNTFLRVLFRNIN